MSRNRIDANTRIFSKLDDYCRSNDVALATSGRPRWIATKSPDRFVLDQLKISELTDLGGGKHLGFGDLAGKKFYIVSGFSFAEPPSHSVEIEPGPGHLTAILADVPLPVVATPYEVKDIVDVYDKATEGYEGHNHAQIAKLFPSVRIFSSDVDLEGPWNGFFRICVEERSGGVEALNREFRDELVALAELDPHRLPYRALCRSIFDSDPSSLFLALYRCLESLYSYSSASELGRRFKLEQDWLEIAATLEEVTGWYPKEDSGLERLLQLASPEALRALVHAAGHEISEGQLIATKAAKVIYSIRNRTVHYRPSHQMGDLQGLNWSHVCFYMVGILLDVYVEAGRSASHE